MTPCELMFDNGDIKKKWAFKFLHLHVKTSIIVMVIAVPI